MAMHDDEFLYETAAALAVERLLDALVPPFDQELPHSGDREMAALAERRERTREKFRYILREGLLDSREIEIELCNPVRVWQLREHFRFDDAVRAALRRSASEIDGEDWLQLGEEIEEFLGPRSRRRMTIGEARPFLADEEFARLAVIRPIMEGPVDLSVLEPAKIIVVQESLLNLLRGKPELLYQISHRQFEEVVFELFAKLGFEVELTAQTRDGGADIIAFSQDHLGIRTKYVIEAKHYAAERKIGVGIIRQVSSVRQKLGAHHGIIVTSSFFTADARKENREYYGLHLKDHDHLMDWIRSA